MPGYSRLYRRGATYYFRVVVPHDLRKSLRKTEITKSLRTTDYAEAKRLVALNPLIPTRFSSLSAGRCNQLHPGKGK